MIGNGRRKLTGACCAAVISLCVTASAEAAVDPVSVYTPPLPTAKPPGPPPGPGFEGPCGLAVDIAGNFYVSDYYHHTVDVFGPTPTYKAQATEVDPLDGPCGLAVDSTGKLYVNSYHRNVVRYTPSTFPNLTTNTIYGSSLTIDSNHPTGVAVSAGDVVYVNDRTRIVAYTTAGVQLQEIGLGNLGDGYGVAHFGGRLYVPDAATNTVKIYNPAVDVTTPEKVITGPPGGFGSLVDSAIAVDWTTGDVYVADRRGSPFTELPESTIQIFDSGGNYQGHLKYNVIDAAPTGLAVDNSAGVNQGRVYVTSGNTSGAVVYIYTSNAATTSAPLPPISSAASSGPSTGSSTASDAPVTRGATPAMEDAVPAEDEATSSSATTPKAKRRVRHRRHRSARLRHHAKRRHS